MKERLNQFILNTQGQFIEVSYREAIYQCMDLVYNWVFCLGLPKETIQHQYAFQVFTEPNDLTREYFEIIKNSDSFIPQDGDIGVFQGGEAGHIVVCLSGGTTATFPCFEQNSPLGRHAHITTNKKYYNFMGVLRPKLNKLDFIISDQTILPILDNYQQKMEVGAARSKIYDQELTIATLKTKNDNLLHQIDILMMSQTSPSQPGHVITEETTPPTSQEETTQNSAVFQIISRWIKKILGLWKEK